MLIAWGRPELSQVVADMKHAWLQLGYTFLSNTSLHLQTMRLFETFDSNINMENYVCGVGIWRLWLHILGRCKSGAILCISKLVIWEHSYLAIREQQCVFMTLLTKRSNNIFHFEYIFAYNTNKLPYKYNFKNLLINVNCYIKRT